MVNENEIRKLMDLDLHYQQLVKEAHDKKVNIEEELQPEKEKIERSIWETVKAEVRDEKDRLNNLVEEARIKDQKNFENSKMKLDEKYKDNKDKWITELFERIIEV